MPKISIDNQLSIIIGQSRAIVDMKPSGPLNKFNRFKLIEFKAESEQKQA